jgi:CRISPR-associated protein Cmr6
VQLRTTGPFVTGLGINHPVENGFLWHHTLGVPYIPGSSIKGLLRSWVEEWEDREDKKDMLFKWFGSVEKGAVTATKSQAGGFVFLDALPVKCPDLAADILTPHMGGWYNEGSSKPNTAETLPADWHDPVPSPFLVVKDAVFSFGVIPTNKEAAKDMAELRQMLLEALEWLGIGAKTAVGYGALVETAESRRVHEGIKAIQEGERVEQTAILQATEEGLEGIAAEIYVQAQRELWTEQHQAFYSGVEYWLERIALEDDKNACEAALKIVRTILEKFYPGICADPEKMTGKKKKKNAFKAKPRLIAQRILAFESTGK